MHGQRLCCPPLALTTSTAQGRRRGRTSAVAGRGASEATTCATAHVCSAGGEHEIGGSGGHRGARGRTTQGNRMARRSENAQGMRRCVSLGRGAGARAKEIHRARALPPRGRVNAGVPRRSDEGTTARQAQGEARRRRARAGGRSARTSAEGSTGRGYHVFLVPSSVSTRTGRRRKPPNRLDDARGAALHVVSFRLQSSEFRVQWAARVRRYPWVWRVNTSPECNG